MLGGGVPALAAEDDRPPSEQDVRDAQQAVTRVEGQVATMDAEVLDLTGQLREVQARATAAGEVAMAAQLDYETKQGEADALAEDAAAARAQADDANTVLGRHAATAYKSGGLGTLGVLFDQGTDTVLERAGSLEVIGKIRNREVQEATTASGTADVLEREAALAAAQAEAAAMEADRTAQAADEAVATAQAETTRLEAQRQSTIEELARVRQVSVDTENARQAWLQAEADRIAALSERRWDAYRRGLAESAAPASPPITYIPAAPVTESESS